MSVIIPLDEWDTPERDAAHEWNSRWRSVVGDEATRTGDDSLLFIGYETDIDPAIIADTWVDVGDWR